MKRLHAALTIAILVAVCAEPTSAQQTLHLTLQSPPGEWVGGGQNWDVTYTEANTAFFNVSLGAFNGASLPNYLTFNVMQTPISTNYLLAFFGTNMVGLPLQAGTYLDAERAPFASPGHPGLDVSFQHRGSNTLTGSFVINSIAYHQDGSEWILDSFDASFVQHSEGGPLALTGTFAYSVPAPGAFLTFVFAGVAAGRRRRG